MNTMRRSGHARRAACATRSALATSPSAEKRSKARGAVRFSHSFVEFKLLAYAPPPAKRLYAWGLTVKTGKVKTMTVEHA